jgi:hypothetical protein
MIYERDFPKPSMTFSARPLALAASVAFEVDVFWRDAGG